MNMNSFLIPKSTLEYFENEFRDQFEIIKLDHSDDTIRIKFNRELTEMDISDIFFTGAKWAINYNLNK